MDNIGTHSNKNQSNNKLVYCPFSLNGQQILIPGKWDWGGRRQFCCCSVSSSFVYTTTTTTGTKTEYFACKFIAFRIALC